MRESDSLISISIRLALILSLISVAEVLSSGMALAHTGDDAGMGHVVVEFGRWGLGAAGVLAVILLVFWIRTKVGPQ